LAVVAASANANAIANLDMTGFSSCRARSARRHDSVSGTIGEELGARMAAVWTARQALAIQVGVSPLSQIRQRFVGT
jgi:hypothetical protein